MNASLRDQLGQPLWNLVTAGGTPPIRIEEITPMRTDGRRRTYRLWFEDGRVLKGRCFASAERARVAWRILTELNAPFLARAIAREGEAMLEEWVEGERLAETGAGRVRMREAGRMLGTLHASPPPTMDIDIQPLDGPGWARRTAANLRALQEQGIVSAERASWLNDLTHASVPPSVPIGIVHRDFSPENLIVDKNGRLMSVDNASLTIGAIDYDVCRVWHRWPMTADERTAFNEGYRQCRDADGLTAPPRFWAIAVVTNAARVRLGLSTSLAAAEFARLDEYLTADPLGAGAPHRGSP